MNARFLLFLSLALLAGCCLPPGEAPQGNIVSNRVEVKTRAGVSEHLATKLSLYLLEKHPRAAWALDADAASRNFAENAVRECALLGSRCVQDAPLRLRGETLSDNSWRFTFFESGKAVWSETYCDLKE